MRIQIKEKFRPFSHEPGTICLIPRTAFEARIYPAKIFFRNLETFEEKEVALDTLGPVHGFTVHVDLERGEVSVFGRSKRGHFRYLLDEKQFPFLKKTEIPHSKKRLHLGVGKAQDFSLMRRRMDMAEIFPFWLKMAYLIPKVDLPKKAIGTMVLLEEGKLDLAFQASFQGIFSPRLSDENFLGLIPESKKIQGVSPIGILHEGARQIEELFFQEQEETWNFLPNLPKEFHAGRFVQIETKVGDLIDIEWSKKSLKKAVIRPAKTRDVSLGLKRGLKSFRIRKSPRQKGEIASKNVALEAGKLLYLDRFTK